MAWIKRNLFFVISMAVGVILTGYCGWLWYGAHDDNGAAKTELDGDISQLHDLQGKGNSKELITQISEDAKNVREFEAQARTVYAPFASAPKMNDQEFATYLADTISKLRLQATNAQVELPPDYAFAFTDWQSKLKYPPENIEPWLNQISEIKVICDILFRAKINSLVNLRRIQVSGSDTFQTGTDSLQAGQVVTPVATITPYKFTIKCFTLELENVLKGLAQSSNCFIVKNIVVYPAGPKPVDNPGAAGQNNQTAPLKTLPRPPQPRNTPGEDRQAYMQAEQRWEAAMRRIDAQEAALNAAPTAAAPGVATVGKGPATTVLREQLLLITLAVDVVKFKPADKK